MDATKSNDLSRKQRRAAILLGRYCWSPAEVARQFKVSAKTVYAWRNHNPAFKELLKRESDLAEEDLRQNPPSPPKP